MLDLVNNTNVAQFNLWAEENNQLVLMTMDHIIPLSKGGRKRNNKTVSNLQVLCVQCNRLKGNRLIRNEKLQIEVDNLKRYGRVKV